MREIIKTRFQLKTTVMFVVTMVMMVLVIGMTTIVSHAEEGKVTASSVKIRASADTNSEMIGGALQGDVLTITGEVPDADGVHTWYQVTFEGNRTGYVRSDLMQKVSGGSTGTSTTPATSPSTVTGDVTALQPVGAKVTGEQVRVRSNASTSGSIVSTVQRDAVLTVVGMAKDSEQKTWYQVNFSDASGQLSGYVREDFVSVEGEIVPADQVPTEPDPVVTDPVDPAPTQEPEPVHKDYDTQLYDGKWYLADYLEDAMYPISDLLVAGPQNKALYEEAEAKLKSTKIIMIILVVLVVVLALATTLLFFKVRDMMDAAYFEEVEKETMRNRQGQRSSGKASMPTVGSGSRSSGGGQQKSSGGGQARPAGSSSQSKPSGGGQARPAGSSGQSKPSGSGQARPAGSNGQPKPSGSGQQAKPAGGQSHSGQQTSRPAGQQSKPVSREAQNPPKQSKNFIADDDEFDFEYLNWDGEEDN